MGNRFNYRSRQIILELLLILLVLITMAETCSSTTDVGEQNRLTTLPSEAFCGQIYPHGTVMHKININRGTNSALFFLNWTENDSDLGVTLITPEGCKVSPTSENVKYEQEDNHEIYLLQEPESGAWTAEVTAGNLQNKEEDYCLRIAMATNRTESIQDNKKKAKLNGVYSSYGVHTDTNDLYDYIIVKVGIDVLTPGWYMLDGSLYDADGVEFLATNKTNLGFGSKSILLKFYGSEAQGQRRLGNLTLYDENSYPIDHVDWATVTDAYNNMEQETVQARLTGEYSDHGTDTNSDGFYDFLTIDAGIDVQVPGKYSLTGTLYDQKGEEIVWSIAHENLSTGYQKMILDFDGKTIWRHGANGPYILKDLLLSGKNWSMSDLASDAYSTAGYNASQFVDPIYPEKVISGSGSGEMLMTFVIEEVLPVFSGRYSQDIVGINMPPISSPFQVSGSTSGYAYDAEGIYIPGKPNNFTVTADGVKNLNIGLRKDPVKNGINATRTWVTTQIDASSDSRAVAETDLVSPGSYHVKIFGDAWDNATEVNLVLTVAKKILVDGEFNLSINTTGFPPGNYSLTAKALNGSFEFDELNIGGLL